jgi:transposase
VSFEHPSKQSRKYFKSIQGGLKLAYPLVSPVLREQGSEVARATDGLMPQQATSGNLILEIVRTKTQWTLEEVTQELQDWPWQDVFLEVDRLSRLGHLTLNKSGYG